MAKKIDHISLKKSTVLDKAPLAKDLVDGELAVNIAKDGEKIFLKNTASEIVEFSSDKLLNKKYLSTTSGGTVSGDTEFKGDVKIVYPDSSSTTVSLREVMVNNEMTISAALNDLNTRIEDQKKTVDSNSTIIGNISTKVNELLPLSGGTVSGETTFTKDTTFDNIKLKYPKTDSEAVSLRDVMLENEKVTAAALNDLNERVNDHKSDIDTIKTQKYLPLSGGTVSGEATFTNDVKIAYPDSGSTPVSLRKVMADNEEVTAASLNDLNDKINKIGDISIANGVLIINDGNTKYKLNLEQLVTGGYATKE